MNRQRAAQVHISPLHVQQGLFALLALLVTLVAGQLLQRMDQSPQVSAPLLPVQHTTQTHFSAVSSRLADSAPPQMLEVEQIQSLDGVAGQERWVF